MFLHPVNLDSIIGEKPILAKALGLPDHKLQQETLAKEDTGEGTVETEMSSKKRVKTQINLEIFYGAVSSSKDHRGA